MSAAFSSQPLVTALQLRQLLVTFRRRRKRTQAELAPRGGLSQNRISYLEKNPDALSFKQLLSWRSATGPEFRLGDKVSSGVLAATRTSEGMPAR